MARRDPRCHLPARIPQHPCARMLDVSPTRRRGPSRLRWLANLHRDLGRFLPLRLGVTLAFCCVVSPTFADAARRGLRSSKPALERTP